MTGSGSRPWACIAGCATMRVTSTSRTCMRAATSRAHCRASSASLRCSLRAGAERHRTRHRTATHGEARVRRDRRTADAARCRRDYRGVRGRTPRPPAARDSGGRIRRAESDRVSGIRPANRARPVPAARGLQTEPFVMFLGKITPRKRLDVLVRAFAAPAAGLATPGDCRQRHGRPRCGACAGAQARCCRPCPHARVASGRDRLKCSPTRTLSCTRRRRDLRAGAARSDSHRHARHRGGRLRLWRSHRARWRRHRHAGRRRSRAREGDWRSSMPAPATSGGAPPLPPPIECAPTTAPRRRGSADGSLPRPHGRSRTEARRRTETRSVSWEELGDPLSSPSRLPGRVSPSSPCHNQFSVPPSTSVPPCEISPALRSSCP